MALKTLIKEFRISLGNQESVLDTRFKHLADKIELHWGYDEFYPFIERLMVDTRDGKRAGFPLDVIQEIVTLLEIHEKLYPPKKRF